MELKRIHDHLENLSSLDVLTGIDSLSLPHEGLLRCPGKVTISLGVATAMAHQLNGDPKALVVEADEALYDAKLQRKKSGLHPNPPITLNDECQSGM